MPIYWGAWNGYIDCDCLVWWTDGNGDNYIYTIYNNDFGYEGKNKIVMEVSGTTVNYYLYSDDDSIYDDFSFSALGMIYDNEGDMVYSESPIVSKTSTIIFTTYEVHSKQTQILYDGEPDETVLAYYEYDFQWGEKYSAWTQNEGTSTTTERGSVWYTQDDANMYMYNTSLTYTLDTEETDNGLRLNGITLTGEFAGIGDQDYTATVSDVFSKFLVPKTVNTGGETQAGWLTKDMPSDQITISCREVETGKMAVYYNQWDYYAEHNDYPEPIYVQDMTENPILILAIGETWAAYIDTLPSNLDDPYQGEQGKIRFGGGGYVFTFSLRINPNGTASYRNNAEIEGNTITKSDLIAYISPEGNLVPYYNENAPKSSTLYSYLSYANKTETANMGLNVIAMNGYENPTVNAEGFRYENSLEVYTVTASYTTSGDYVTGMNVTATYQSDSTEYSFPFTGQTPPEPYDMEWPDNESNTGVYSVAFSVVESGTEETSGGNGGGLSPTLVTVLSIIPIMVLVGLVLMAVRSMKV